MKPVAPPYIMGLISMLFSGTAANRPELAPAQFDLGSFRCGSTVLGSKIGTNETFSSCFDSNDVADFKTKGVEIGRKEGELDYFFITLTDFSGAFQKAGKPVSISANTTPEQVLSEFDQPYWIDDRDSDETIYFYEYQNGGVELQFEFPGKRKLGFITLMRNGILSHPSQRKGYGVTKDWPPK